MGGVSIIIFIFICNFNFFNFLIFGGRGVRGASLTSVFLDQLQADSFNICHSGNISESRTKAYLFPRYFKCQKKRETKIEREVMEGKRGLVI